MIQNNAKGLKELINYSTLFKGISVEQFLSLYNNLSTEGRLLAALVLKGFTMNRNKVRELRQDVDYLYGYRY